MADFAKHRKENVQFASEFENALASGDSLSSVSSIVVTRFDATAGPEDVSSEFGSPSGAISGTQVQYDLGAAGTDEQEEGDYQILVLVATTNGETLHDLAHLFVTADGDPDAP